MSTNFFSSPLRILLLAFGMAAIFPAHAMVTYAMPLKGDEHMIGNLLEWKTAQEFKSKTFMVEKSIDGITYENIGLVEAAGESMDEKGYRFLDINATADRAFYRLKQVDNDGATSISETAVVNRVIPNQFMVINMSKTITASNFTCAIDAMQANSMQYQLVKMIDKEVVQSGKLDMYAGLNELGIDLTNEAAGIYELRLNVADEVETLILQKVMDEAQTKDNVAVKH